MLRFNSRAGRKPWFCRALQSSLLPDPGEPKGTALCRHSSSAHFAPSGEPLRHNIFLSLMTLRHSGSSFSPMKLYRGRLDQPLSTPVHYLHEQFISLRPSNNNRKNISRNCSIYTLLILSNVLRKINFIWITLINVNTKRRWVIYVNHVKSNIPLGNLR